MTLRKAIKQLEDIGRAYYQPVGAMLLEDRPHVVATDGWSVPYDDRLNLNTLVKDFYDAHADEFADGYWLCLEVIDGRLYMEVCDE